MSDRNEINGVGERDSVELRGSLGEEVPGPVDAGFKLGWNSGMWIAGSGLMVGVWLLLSGRVVSAAIALCVALCGLLGALGCSGLRGGQITLGFGC